MSKFTDFEKEFTKTVGQRILSVFYQVVNYESDPDTSFFLEDFHSADISVILQTSDSDFFEFYWGNTFSAMALKCASYPNCLFHLRIGE